MQQRTPLQKGKEGPVAESRVIRKGFVDSERVNELSWFAECLYHRLLLVADDYGCFDARIAYIRTQLFGMKLDSVKEADLQRGLAECEKAGLVRFYEVNGKPYLMLERYRQRIQSKRRYPQCPTVPHSTPPSPTVLHSTPPCPTVLHSTPPCPTVNHRLVGVGVGVGVEVEAEVGVDSSLSESTSRATAIKRPALVDVTRAMALLKLSKLQEAELHECATRFLDGCEASGWRDKHGIPLADWRAAARNFARRYAENLNKHCPPTTTHTIRKDCNNADDYR